jgi:hypothetical protein
MANYYIAATGNWSSASTWSATSGGAGGAGVPTSADHVYIDNNYIVTLNANATCYSIDHTSGSLNLSSYTMDTQSRISSYGNTARTINLSSGLFNISNGANTTALQFRGTNLNFLAGSSTITLNIPTTYGSSCIFETNSLTFNNVIVSLGSGSESTQLDIIGSPTFRLLDIRSANTNAHSVIFDDGSTTTVSKFVAIGSSSTNKLTIDGANGASFTTLPLIKLTDGSSSYGQYVATNYITSTQTSSKAGKPYIGANSSRTISNGATPFLIQDPPKISTLIDPLTTAPSSSTNWQVATYSGAALPTATTTGISGGGYRFAANQGIVSKDSYDIVDNDLVFEVSGDTDSTNSDFGIALGWLDGNQVQTSFAAGLIEGAFAAVASGQINLYDKQGSVALTTVPAFPFYIKVRYNSVTSKMQIAYASSSGIWSAFTNSYRTFPSYAAVWFKSSTLQATHYNYSGLNTADLGSINPALQPSKSQIATADIKINMTKTQTATSRLALKGIKSQPAKAAIKGLINKSQTSKARISESSYKIQTSIGRVATNIIKVQTANAHITSIVTHTQQAVAHIIKSSDIPKRYLYKVYTGNQFLGLLPNVTSEFAYSQDINTAGAQITVTVGVSADTSYLPTTTTVDDETGVSITDENGDNLLTEGAVNIVGVGISGPTLIKNGNHVVVYEYGKYYPNGKVVFNGQMEKWNASFGGANGTDDITILCYSVGQDMDNRVIYTGSVSQNIQSVDNATVTGATWGSAFAQAIKPTANVDVGVINLKVSVSTPLTSAYLTLYLCQGDPSLDQLNILGGGKGGNYQFGGSNHILATSSSVTVAGTTPSVKTFTFPSNTTLTAGGAYYYLAYDTAGTSSTLVIEAATTGTTMTAPFDKLYYARATANNASYGMNYDSTHPMLYIELLKKGGNTLSTYTDLDPSAMLTSIMDDYAGQGGAISYTPATIQNTGLSLTYTFNTNTSYEGLKAVLSLAPDGFYYYVDLGSNLLYFKQASTTADILIVKGKHIESVNLIASTENIANTVYFSGGIPTGQTTNLYKVYRDTTTVNNSIALYGQRIQRKSDNRVTISTTADAIGISSVQESKDEQYQTVVSILDSMMDISQLRLGMIVGFRGFGTFVDTIISQVVRIDYTPHKATLTLGILPRRIVPEFERITRGLIAEQTIQNPTAPS